MRLLFLFWWQMQSSCSEIIQHSHCHCGQCLLYFSLSSAVANPTSSCKSLVPKKWYYAMLSSFIVSGNCVCVIGIFIRDINVPGFCFLFDFKALAWDKCISFLRYIPVCTIPLKMASGSCWPIFSLIFSRDILERINTESPFLSIIGNCKITHPSTMVWL